MCNVSYKILTYLIVQKFEVVHKNENILYSPRFLMLIAIVRFFSFEQVSLLFHMLYSEECHCGNTLKYAALPSILCYVKATGNSNDLAGGGWALSVYAAKYMGCYQDASARSLDGATYYDNSNMTAIACVSFCVKNGFLYAGLEVG